MTAMILLMKWAKRSSSIFSKPNQNNGKIFCLKGWFEKRTLWYSEELTMTLRNLGILRLTFVNITWDLVCLWITCNRFLPKSITAESSAITKMHIWCFGHIIRSFYHLNQVLVILSSQPIVESGEANWQSANNNFWGRVTNYINRETVVDNL